MPIIHRLEVDSKMKLSIKLGLICMFCSFIPLLLPGSLWLAVLAILAFTFGEIFYLPFNNAIPFNVSNEQNRGAYMSWYWMTWSLTSILGPFIGLRFSGAFGFRAFWVFLFVIAGLSLALSMRRDPSLSR
ncbi:MAG: hypothetical protein AAGM67_03900, partial [Bacteroidota bacterium]